MSVIETNAPAETSSLALVAGEVASTRFAIGADEIKVADVWRKAEGNVHKAALAFVETVIVAHQIDIAWLAPLKDGESRTQVQQAGFDFVRSVYSVYKIGAAATEQLFDRNVPGDATIKPAGGRKPQPKRALKDSILGSKEWGKFVKILKALKDELDGIEAEKRGASTPKTDAKFVADCINSAIKRLRRDAEKHDGSIDLVQSGKLANFLADALKVYGLNG
jgi:hypothetical protein